MGRPDEPLRFAPRGGMHAPHPVVMCGLRGAGEGLQRPPLLVERRDEDFVEGLYADLLDPEQRATVPSQAPGRSTPRGSTASVARLFPPVQRVFNLALLELLCDHPGLVVPSGGTAAEGHAGLPRLDPRKVDSCGLVLRRVLATPQGGARYEAWLRSGTRVFGWGTLDPDHEDDDPAADRRRPASSVGNAALNARLPSNQKVASALSLRLAGQKQPVHEHVMPAFVAPPDVCAATGRTVVLGVVQVTSSEQTELGSAAPGYGQDPEERRLLQAHLADHLRDGGPFTLPCAGQTFDSAWALSVGQPGNSARRTQFDSLSTITTIARQLGVELDAFGTTAAARALRSALDTLQVEYDSIDSQGRTVTRRASAGAFYEAAYKVLLLAEPGASFTVPQRTVAVTPTQASALLDVICKALDERYRALRPGRGRFEADSRAAEPRYVVRAFVRLKPEHAGCPGRIVWSPVSEEFTIAPWWESAGRAPTLVEMPDLFDRNVLKRLKPNVSLVLPPKLAKLVEGDPKKLRDGEGDPGDGLGLAWICSFSIPIITICAFIVLMIFVILLNLIFWWLPFLKVCIPYPTRQPPQ